MIFNESLGIFVRSNEENTYLNACETFDPEMCYEEYVVHIFRCLLISDWHYSPDHATDLIKESDWYIQEAYAEKIPPAKAMLEVGFGCG